jgi:hypothetical protein
LYWGALWIMLFLLVFLALNHLRISGYLIEKYLQ